MQSLIVKGHDMLMQNKVFNKAIIESTNALIAAIVVANYLWST